MKVNQSELNLTEWNPRVGYRLCKFCASPRKTKVPLVLLFSLLKAVKHWNFHRQSLSNKTQQIMRQNKKPKTSQNKQCKRRWKFHMIIARLCCFPFFLFCSPVNRTWQSTKGFLPHVKGSDENLTPLATANNMYVLWKMRKMWKSICI